MIIGGRSGSDFIDTVELFNWETGEQCYLSSPFPEKFAFSSGAVLNGVPVVCGGNGADGVAQKNCYKFDVNSYDWLKVIISSNHRTEVQESGQFLALRRIS